MINVFLWIISGLLTFLLIILGIIGTGFNKRIDHVDSKFETIFEELKLYQKKEICSLLMAYHEKEDRELKKQINGVANISRGVNNNGS